MISLIEWILTTLGFVYLVTQSAIFLPVRRLVSRGGLTFEVGIYCPACVGFWVGILAKGPTWTLGLDLWQLVQAAVGGCALGAIWSVYGPESPWEHEQKQERG